MDLVTPQAASRRRWIGEGTPDRRLDLLVLARFPGASLLVGDHVARVRFSSCLPCAAAGPALRRAIDLPDLVDEGGVIRARFDYALGVGRREPIPNQQIAFVSGGRIIAEVATSDGDAELSPSPGVDSLGVFRVEASAAPDPLTAIEEQVEVIRPGSRPLLLFDADLAANGLSAIAGLGGPEAPDALAVRLRPMQSCKAIRARLHLAGLAARVVDASAVLDEGEAFDVPVAVDPVRLARVAARLRAAGFPVAAIVHKGEHTPSTIGFAALRAEDLASTPLRFEPPAPGPPSLASRLEATTGAPLLAGNRIEVEMDNRKARRWLLEAIGKSRRRVHLQVYMALDDDVGAADRGGAGRGGRARRHGPRRRRLAARSARLPRHAESAPRAPRKPPGRRAPGPAAGHGSPLAGGPEAARPSQGRHHRRRAGSAGRAQSFSRVLHRLRGSEPHPSVVVARSALAGRRRASGRSGRRGVGAFVPPGLDRGGRFRLRYCRDSGVRPLAGARGRPPRAARRLHPRDLPCAHRDREVARVRRERLSPDSRDPACLAARAPPRRSRARALRQPHAHARRQALRGALGHSAGRGDGAGRLPHRHGRRGRRRVLSARDARAAWLGRVSAS